MESASVNADLPDVFPPAPQLTGEGAPVLLVAVLAAMGAALAAVSASIWLAPPVTPPEPVTIVVHDQSPPPPPIVIREPAPPPVIIREPALPPSSFTSLRPIAPVCAGRAAAAPLFRTRGGHVRAEQPRRSPGRALASPVSTTGSVSMRRQGWSLKAMPTTAAARRATSCSVSPARSPSPPS